MKRKIFVALFMLITIAGQSQRVTGCGYIVPPRSLRNNFSSVYEAKSILQNMLDSIKWVQNFQVKEENGIQNAYATIINKARWIIYDNAFLESIDSYTSTKWSSISVLAHEMGHHYYDHVVDRQGSTPPKEIEADGFSGYVMQKLGASLKESIAAISAIASDRASATHPGKRDRVTAITNGWNAALKASTTNNNTSPPPPPNPLPKTTNPPPSPTPTTNNPPTNPGTTTSPENDPSWISLSIYSGKTENVMLSDDGKTFQAAELKPGEPFIFKFEVYQFGWLKLPYYNGYRVYKLFHGKDYSILWNRRTKNWTVVEVPE